MSDGREERERQREQEQRESREDLLDRHPVDQWERERKES